jgi:hypothetical protein
MLVRAHGETGGGMAEDRHCPEPTTVGIGKQTGSDGVAFKQVNRVRGVRNYALPRGPT